jgi:Zn-dependent protease
MNFFGQSIPLGRWFGIRVEVHFLFVIYAIYTIYRAKNPTNEAFFMAVLFGTVLLHEFGHSLTCRAVGGTADRILLWPLGGLAFVAPPPRPWPQLLTTIGGPAVNVALIPIFYVLLRFVLPLIPPESMAFNFLENIWFAGFEISLVLLIFNLLPVYPLDGGRIVQEILWFFVGYPKSLLISGMTGTAGGVAFVGLGLGLAQISLPIPFLGSFPLGGDFRTGHVDTMLVFIGIMAAFASFNVYRQAQQIESWRKN